MLPTHATLGVPHLHHPRSECSPPTSYQELVLFTHAVVGVLPTYTTWELVLPTHTILGVSAPYIHRLGEWPSHVIQGLSAPHPFNDGSERSLLTLS